MSLAHLVSTYGALIVFLGSGLEGETIAFVGGVAANRGDLPYVSVATAAILGAFTASQILFLLGRHAGSLRLVQWLKKTRTMSQVDTLLRHHQTAFILGFRFIYGFHTVGPLAVGISSVPAVRFLALNAATAIVWGLAFTAIGYVFGKAIETYLGLHAIHLHLILGIVAAAIFVPFIAMGARKTFRKLHTRAH